MMPKGAGGLPESSLLVIESPDSMILHRNFHLIRFPFSIGREDADLVIAQDPLVSRQHARIHTANGELVITDLASSNGTWVNGRRVGPERPEVLPFGATIQIGHTSLSVLCEALDVMPDLTGAVIAERYVLQTRIHVGAISATYVASDRNMRTVVVKIHSPRLFDAAAYVEEFLNEAKITARLQHPHIAGIVDVGQTILPSSQTAHYICMEYLAGGSLESRLEPGAPAVEPADALRWLRPVAEALDYMHTEGIVHGGIKPTSVVFNKEGAAYLTDFAIASESSGKDRGVLGAPDFLSPEQLEGKSAQPASDQYSLAVLAYALLTGSLPHTGQRDPEIRKRNLARGPVPAHLEAKQKDGKTLSPRVSAALAKALSPVPADRFSTVVEFMRVLEAAVTDRRSTSATQVFLSYHRETSAGWANLFAQELRNTYSISSFLDTNRSDSVVRFPARIEQAIANCDVFVCFLGPGTLDSDWVCHEIRCADSLRKAMLPVFHEDFKYPEAVDSVDPAIRALLEFDGVHLLDKRNIHVEHTIADLANKVKEEVNRRREERAEAGSA